MIVIVMGVSGAGKSTIGRGLAERLRYPFLDADEFHPPENVAKMASGSPLTDADRAPWLGALNRRLRDLPDAVLACSALKASYREQLAHGLADCRFVHLHGNIAVIRERLAARQHRYMPASLLESQYATLEPPRDAIEVDIAANIPDCIQAIAAHLAR